MPPPHAPSTSGDRAAREGVYDTDRPDVLRLVPLGARRVLDLGCSNGALGAAIKRRQDAHVTGVEIDASYAEEARGKLDEVVLSDVEGFVARRSDRAPFDCLICADVLEHLVDPWSALAAAVDLLQPGATVIVSLPNVLHWRSLLRVLRRRRWPRDDWGVFDRTHLRWFTLQDACELMTSSGLTIEHVHIRVWHRSEQAQARLNRLSRTPAGPFIGQQHVLLGRGPGGA